MDGGHHSANVSGRAFLRDLRAFDRWVENRIDLLRRCLRIVWFPDCMAGAANGRRCHLAALRLLHSPTTACRSLPGVNGVCGDRIRDARIGWTSGSRGARDIDGDSPRADTVLSTSPAVLHCTLHARRHACHWTGIRANDSDARVVARNRRCIETCVACAWTAPNTGLVLTRCPQRAEFRRSEHS